MFITCLGNGLSHSKANFLFTHLVVITTIYVIQTNTDFYSDFSYRVFSFQLPLQVKIGYWLTDLLEKPMGNLVILSILDRK